MSRIGTVVLLAAIATIALGERRRPLRRVTCPSGPRIVRNVVMGAMCAGVVALTEAPITQAIARANARQRRGLAGLLPEDWPGCIAAFFASELPTLPLHDTPALALRFLADDIKALYGEAVQEEGGPPSARQIDLWFWRQTVAGQMLIALREVALESKNNGFKTVGGRFFVPAPYLPT